MATVELVSNLYLIPKEIGFASYLTMLMAASGTKRTKLSLEAMSTTKGCKD
jgi:hypothetical protein